MYEHVSLDDLEPSEDAARGRRSFSLSEALETQRLAPRVWEYDEGGTSNRHRHHEQEELYCVLDGRFEMTVEGETLPLEPGDNVIVAPEGVRQLTAITDGRVLIIGAPNVEGDGIPLNREDDS